MICKGQTVYIKPEWQETERMMRLPSVKTLARVNAEHAKELRELLEGKRAPTQYSSVNNWLAQCHKAPSRGEQIMCAANEIINGYGAVEIFANGSYPLPDYEYISTGRRAAETLIRDCRTGRVFVGAIGAVIERGNYQA